MSLAEVVRRSGAARPAARVGGIAAQLIAARFTRSKVTQHMLVSEGAGSRVATRCAAFSPMHLSAPVPETGKTGIPCGAPGIARLMMRVLRTGAS
jgi:hypothetical protein